ncbi:hypothetical protein DRP05_09005 [Archaeoglobales archaeon]|nr:MAG: hypothetical protein DRP05_09005 [Archaeoglobales archaeon]
MLKGGVHVIFGGMEYDRVVRPIISHFPSQKIIVFVSGGKEYPNLSGIALSFMERLKVLPVEIIIKELDMHSFNTIFENLIRHALEEFLFGNDKIYINISWAPRLAVAAAHTAACFINSKILEDILDELKFGNIEIYYVKPEKYLMPDLISAMRAGSQSEVENIFQEFEQSGSAYGMKAIIKVPSFPLESLTILDMAILETIAEHKEIESIQSLIISLKDKKYNIKRSSVQYRVEKLLERKLIKAKKENKKISLSTTEAGLIYLMYYKILMDFKDKLKSNDS